MKLIGRNPFWVQNVSLTLMNSSIWHNVYVRATNNGQSTILGTLTDYQADD